MHDCGLNTWKILLASKKANAMKICKYLTINHKVIFDYLFKSSYMPV